MPEHHPACTRKPYAGGGCKCRWPEIAAAFKAGASMAVLMAKFRRPLRLVDEAIRANRRD